MATNRSIPNSFCHIRLWSGPPGHPGFREVYFLRDIRNMLLTKVIEKFFFLSLCPFFFLALQHKDWIWSLGSCFLSFGSAAGVSSTSWDQRASQTSPSQGDDSSSTWMGHFCLATVASQFQVCNWHLLRFH